MNNKKYDLNILIVEDNKDFLKSLEVVFSRKFNVDTAMSLESALQKIQSKKYNVIITDGAIPRKDNMPFKKHDYLTEEDYRGNIIVKVAKERGIFVIVQTAEPKNITEKPDYIFRKKDLDIGFLVTLIKEQFNLKD